MDKRKKMLMSVLAVMAVVMVAIIAYYWINNALYVSTEDARVSGDIARINAQMQGKLVELDIDEGDTVNKDQIVGRQEAPGQSDTGLEQSILRSPIEGIVIKKQGVPGEVLSPSQAVAMVIDPNNLYIIANIEETQLRRIAVGQTADVSIDQYGGQKWTGTVTLIGQASNSTFSLIPTTGGSTFTKVVQKVPVRIVVDTGGVQLLPGTNAVVKIHVR